MTHPKARTKPRRRERRNPQDRIILTAKGLAILATYHPLNPSSALPARTPQQQQAASDGAAPCAPNRGNNAPAPLPANTAGTAGAPPAHPAGKSGAAGAA